MNTNLSQYIHSSPLCDTHEHLGSESSFVDNPPDILRNLFENYVPADLVVAGASQEAVEALLDGRNPDVRGRFLGVEEAWKSVQFTGYGEAVRLIAQEFYGLEEITADSLERSLAKHEALATTGERLRLLRDVANLDHVQIDDFTRPCPVDESGPDFFLYDISWASLSSGTPDVDALAQETKVEIVDLKSLNRAMETIFEQNAANAIAVKSQHAYNRTLHWQERTEIDAARALSVWLHDGAQMTVADELCLGDWCWARGVELAIEHDLPFKIHTGYYAGHSRMPVDYIKSGHLSPLLKKYLDARFVLMHIAYPYCEELIALAKHYPNVYVDLCWAWSINPYSSADFIRRYLHAAPINKIFAFGGDTSLPAPAVAYARQARTWLTRALQAEVDDDLISEDQAMHIAQQLMMENQYRCFNVEGKKQAVVTSL